MTRNKKLIQNAHHIFNINFEEALAIPSSLGLSLQCTKD